MSIPVRPLPSPIKLLVIKEAVALKAQLAVTWETIVNTSSHESPIVTLPSKSISEITSFTIKSPSTTKSPEAVILAPIMSWLELIPQLAVTWPLRLIISEQSVPNSTLPLTVILPSITALLTARRSLAVIGHIVPLIQAFIKYNSWFDL